MPPRPKFTAWPQSHAPFRTPREIHEAYNRGWQGCVANPEADERLRDEFRSTTGFRDFSDAAHSNGYADSGAGKLVIPFLAIRQYFPNAFPGEAQQDGCCVSMGTFKWAALGTLCCEAVSGIPDSLTGLLEGVPEVEKDGEKCGVLTNAVGYWFRGYDGDGWSCGDAAMVAVKHCGAVVARNYEELGVDLTHCTAHNDHLYGSRQPPADWMKVFGTHKFASAVELHSFEEIRDALYNGKCITSCGGEGFSNHRNEDGVSDRQGSWSHCLAVLGADDREIVKKKYNEPLLWFPNSWANWNSGGLRILGTKIDANPGGFWARYSQVKNRSYYALSNLAGWPAQPLPDWGAEEVLN